MKTPPFLLSAVACVAVFWPGLFGYFQLDDFYWLTKPGLARSTGVLHALLTPTIHGTWRPLSEQAVFLGFSALFGINPMPYRVLVLATQLLNLALLGSLARRLWPLKAAAWLAPLFFAVHAALAMPMVWTSSYNQILCATALLGALRCFALHIDTGRRTWLVAATVVFVLGLFVLETALVFPAVAAAWVVTVAPRNAWRRPLLALLPLGLGSAVFVLQHLLIAPPLTSGAYAPHCDGRIFGAFLRYGCWALVPPHFTDAHSSWARGALALVLTATLGAGVVVQLRRGDRRSLFGLAWYALTLGPLLPLSDHVTDYYLTVPAAGVAIALAGVVQTGLERSKSARLGALSVAVLYLALMAPSSLQVCRALVERTHGARAVLTALRAERRRDPTRVFLLRDVSADVFRYAIGEHALVALELHDVYLTSNDAERLAPLGGAEPAAGLVLSTRTEASLRGSHQARLFSAASDRLTEVGLQEWQSASSSAEGGSGRSTPDP